MDIVEKRLAIMEDDPHAQPRRLATKTTASRHSDASTIRACGLPDALHEANVSDIMDAVGVEEPRGAIALEGSHGQARVQAVRLPLQNNSDLRNAMMDRLSSSQKKDGHRALSQAIVSASAITAPNIAVLADAVADLSESLTELETQVAASMTAIAQNHHPMILGESSA
jgi:hypothetical protein